MAMGAGKRAVFGLVLGKGMKQFWVGAVLGLAMGAEMAQPMAIVFFDVGLFDPVVYAAMVVAMGLAGLLACVVPVLWATSLELVDALRPQ